MAKRKARTLSANLIEYYKGGGKVVASPSSSCGEPCEFMYARGSSMHQKCSNYALNQLVWFV